MALSYVPSAHLERAVDEEVRRGIVLAAAVVVVDRVARVRRPEPVLIHNEVLPQLVRGWVERNTPILIIVDDWLAIPAVLQSCNEYRR